MDDPELDEALNHLFAEPPEEFVVNRDALVRRLRSAKRAEDAATIKRWRRPSRAAWILNRFSLVGDHALAELLEAARLVREVQAGGAPGLRGAMADLRRATRSAADAAVGAITPVHANDHNDVSAGLLSILSDADALALLARGRLLEIPEAGLSGFLSAGEPTGARRSPAAQTQQQSTGRRSHDDDAHRASLRALDRAREAVKDAEVIHRAAAAELGAAQDALQQAAERLDQSRRQLAEAEAAVEGISGAAEAARTKVEATADALEEARNTLAELDQAEAR
jgi:hypothetical protein